ncbi:tRNA lysidine(34) synthetase TilS [Hyphomicrobium sp.]|jgi:tRNA(Ile)-lysidine synthase|uniref:tRNA lysidine(34) synthetase TilS n=1 Tax=Hyphomicrobium sp. TaxID=82 RepID=UPI002FE17381
MRPARGASDAIRGDPARDALAVYDLPDLEALFGVPLAPFKRAVLAVSGGPDSMALMLLVARWVQRGLAPGGLTIEVATVDHGLRAASAREAEWVAERAKALGFRHTTLVWGGNTPGSALQARAREARYALLVAHARTATPAAVVTAHTSDDQAETLLMRLGRGSGLDGLAGMAPARTLLADGSVSLVRPLLGVPKSSLMALLEAQGEGWMDDPSNQRLDFERVRIRAAHGHLAPLGLSNEKLALSAQRLTRARDALEQVTGARLAELVDVHEGVFASIDRAAWEGEPEDIRVRLLTRLIATFGGEAKPPQLSQVEALVAAIARGRALAQTLGGSIVSQGRTRLRLYREPGRRTLPEVTLMPGEEVVWDWRFRIRYAGAADEDASEARDDASAEGVVVRPLGLAAYATLRGALTPRDRPPARAAASLPAVWSGERLVAVPGLAGALPPDDRFSAVFLGFKRAPR